MSFKLTDSQPIERCARCRAILGPDDRFCTVCGTPRYAAPSAAHPGRRGRRLVVSSLTVLLAVIAVVAWIYFSAPDRQKPVAVSRLPNAPSALAILPGLPPVVYAAEPDRLLASVDNGSAWQPEPTSGPISTIAAGASAPPTVFLAGTQLWRGDGRTFEPLTTTLPSPSVRTIAVDPTNSRLAYAFVPNQGVFRTSDAGQTWTLLGANAPGDTTSLAATGRIPGLFLATAQHGVFASGDGVSWTNASGFVNGALPTRAISAVAFDPRSGDQSVAPSGATSTGALYAATDLGIFKSIDDGVSWSVTSFRDPAVALASAADGSRLLLTADVTGNVFRSTDGGVSWR
jgi:hypothetical protein